MGLVIGGSWCEAFYLTGISHKLSGYRGLDEAGGGRLLGKGSPRGLQARRRADPKGGLSSSF